MIDTHLRRALKRVALARFEVDLAVGRLFQRLRGRPLHVLGGECRGNAACCEAPAIRVGRLVWYLPMLRRLFLAWQERVNGLIPMSRDTASHVFVFRCTHFVAATRRCDSYSSRPGICRDYPRILLDQPHPQFFSGCGYRAIARNADGLKQALDAQSLTGEQRERLKRGLRLE